MNTKRLYILPLAFAIAATSLFPSPAALAAPHAKSAAQKKHPAAAPAAAPAAGQTAVAGGAPALAARPGC
jgi:D-alanyl-D-alanine carboxypeptidase (penicillin-binding protein 5/6)